MAENRVVKIFKKLSTQELKVLDKFVRSPIYNQHQDVISLYEYLREAVESGTGALSSERIFEAVFPGQPFEVQRLHYVNSYLLKTLEAFFAWHEWQQDELEADLYLLKAYRNRGMDDQFERSYRKMEEKLRKRPYRNIQHHSLEYRMRLEQVRAASDRRSSNMNLQELSDEQDAWFVVEKLYNASTMLSHQAVVKTEYDMGLLEPILDHLQTSKMLEIPAVSLYYHAFKALKNMENETNYRALKAAIRQYQQQFPLTELRGLYLAALNFCIRRNNRGDKAYLREMFDLYQAGLEFDVFLEKDSFSRWTYRNIVAVAMQLGEYDWVFDFIHTYVNKLPKNHREGTLNFNLAYYYYGIGNFDKAMPLLMQTDHDDVLHNLFAKVLQAKMLYELSDFDALESLLQSLKTYINRKKGLGYHRTNYLNFVRYLQKLITVNPFDKTSQEKLGLQIQEERSLVEKSWLLEKAGFR